MRFSNIDALDYAPHYIQRYLSDRVIALIVFISRLDIDLDNTRDPPLIQTSSRSGISPNYRFNSRANDHSSRINSSRRPPAFTGYRHTDGMMADGC
jgi:hypothetical protein